MDYIWYTPPAEGDAAEAAGGGRYALRPLSVLLPPSLQSLRTGLPAGAWPSDHVSLVADFAVYDQWQQQTQQAQQAQQPQAGAA